MKANIYHLLALILAIVFSFVIAKANLGSYQVPFALSIFILLFIVKKFRLPTGEQWRLFESCAFIVLILWTVLTTGGTDSPFFFLIYFLIFSLGMLLEPMTSLISSLIIIILFILSIKGEIPFRTAVPIFSLAFLAPFAITLATERVENEKLKLQEQTSEENAFLFLSLTIKKHLKTIRDLLENSQDQNAQPVKKQVHIIEKLIEKYERMSDEPISS